MDTKLVTKQSLFSFFLLSLSSFLNSSFFFLFFLYFSFFIFLFSFFFFFLLLFRMGWALPEPFLWRKSIRIYFLKDNNSKSETYDLDLDKLLQAKKRFFVLVVVVVVVN